MVTEKEKMISGIIYDAGDEELVEDKKRAKELCFEFNNIRPSNERRKKNIMKEIQVQSLQRKLGLEIMCGLEEMW